MTFFLGLEQLSKEEKILLLSQFEVLNTFNLVNDTVQKYSKKGKDFVLSTTSKITEKLPWSISNKLGEINKKTNWDPEILVKKLKSKQQELSLKEESELSEMLLEKLKSLADFKSDVSNEILASGIVHRAAKSLKLDHRLYLNNAALESVVFEECIKEQIELLKKNINKMNPEELEKMEHLLTEELTKLSSADREAIKKSLKIDYISGKALLTFIKTASATAMIQMILGSFGFGFFLFLTTMMKAMGLLFGITFSFGAYTTLSTVAGFILSLPFLLISVLVAGGVITKFTNSKIEDEIVKTIIVIGKSKLL